VIKYYDVQNVRHFGRGFCKLKRVSMSQTENVRHGGLHRNKVTTDSVRGDVKTCYEFSLREKKKRPFGYMVLSSTVAS